MRNRIVVAVGAALEAEVLPTLQGYAMTPLVREPGTLIERVDPRRAAAVLVSDGTESVSQASLASLRAAHPLVPVACVVTAPSSSLLQRLGQFDVECLLRPLAPPALHRFAQRSLAFGALPDEAVACWVSRLARARRLTSDEILLLCMALADETRARMRATLGLCENTFKGRVRRLLRKTGERSLDGLAKNVLRVALLEARPGRRDVYGAPWLARGVAA